MEKCKQRDLLEQLLAEMGEDYPHLSRIFVEERDAYMTYVLHNLLINNTIEKRLAWRKTNGSVEFQVRRNSKNNLFWKIHPLFLQSRWTFQKEPIKIRISRRQCRTRKKSRELLFSKTFLEDGGKLFYSLGYNLNPICNRPFFTNETRNKISETLKSKYCNNIISKTHTKKCYQYNRFTGELKLL